MAAAGPVVRLALIMCLAFCASASAADVTITRIAGSVTSGTYRALETLLFDSFDKIVGLKVTFDAFDGAEPDRLSAYVDDEKFVAFVSGPDSESEIVADKGFSYQHGGYVFDGFFLVKSGGFNQGISSIYLQPVDEAQVILSGASISDVNIEETGG